MDKLSLSNHDPLATRASSASSSSSMSHNKPITSSSSSSSSSKKRKYLDKLPKRIILIRHGESLGNADSAAYSTTPDWKIPLTSIGEEQALAAGKHIKDIVHDEPLSIFCSPYLRTKQTLRHVMTGLQDNPVITLREDPRITEQQFGNFQSPEVMSEYKKERSSFGRFYYRFPQGESGLDVFNRVSSFISSLFRDWDKEKDYHVSETNVIIVTHGLTLRLFLMRWYQFSVNEFEASANPENAAIVVMTRSDLVQHMQPARQPSGRIHSSGSATTMESNDDLHSKPDSAGISIGDYGNGMVVLSSLAPSTQASHCNFTYFGQHTQHNFVIDDETLQSMRLKSTVATRQQLFTEIMSKSIPTTPHTPSSTGSDRKKHKPCISTKRPSNTNLSASSGRTTHSSEFAGAMETSIESSESSNLNPLTHSFTIDVAESYEVSPVESPNRRVAYAIDSNMEMVTVEESSNVHDGLSLRDVDRQSDAGELDGLISEEEEDQVISEDNRLQMARLQSLAKVSMAVLLKETDCESK